MKLHTSIIILLVISFSCGNIFSQNLGVDNLSDYLPFLKNKNIGLVVNHTSQINNTHLVDTLISLNINISSIFTPEHGFSGKFDAGEYFNDSLYNDTIPIISLYTNKIIKAHHVNNIDVIVFDIQDVGVRFYTYISTLHYVMEACAENSIKLIVLDRPNPHDHYVDGPVLELKYASFVGMHPVPIIYGMTIGEYALMINGEGWLKNKIFCDLEIIKICSYSRKDIISINSPPSPNLRNMNAIFLYPSLCLFEGTLLSVGRGTNAPFEVYGAPFLESDFSFKPFSNLGAKYPKFENEICYGFDLRNIFKLTDFRKVNQINLNYLITAYQKTPDKYKLLFFNNFFNKLSGNQTLKEDIINGLTENEIREKWQVDLNKFLMTRNKYLLYD